MSAVVIFSYPRTDDVKFDHDYYTTSHMPFVARTWAKYGMRSWEAFRMADDESNVAECTLRWDSIEAFEKALKEEATEVLADVKNYSNVSPIIRKGKVEGQGSA